jgi:O-antigen/teichoic acid export membrane protein
MQRYALSLVPYAAFTWIIGVSDRYIIQWLSPNADDVGIYSAAYAVVSQPFIMAITMQAAALRPVWFSAVAHDDMRAAGSVFRQWMIAAVSIAGAGAILCWLLAPWATRILLAPKYAAALSLMPWIAAGYFFFSVQQVLEVQLLAHRRTRAVVAVGAAGAVLSVAVTIPLVSRFGMQGAAYACPIYFGGQCALSALVALGGKRPGAGRQAPDMPKAEPALSDS